MLYTHRDVPGLCTSHTLSRAYVYVKRDVQTRNTRITLSRLSIKFASSIVFALMKKRRTHSAEYVIRSIRRLVLAVDIWLKSIYKWLVIFCLYYKNCAIAQVSLYVNWLQTTQECLIIASMRQATGAGRARIRITARAAIYVHVTRIHVVQTLSFPQLICLTTSVKRARKKRRKGKKKKGKESEKKRKTKRGQSCQWN